jgi:hypothetical protein
MWTTLGRRLIVDVEFLEKPPAKIGVNQRV